MLIKFLQQVFFCNLLKNNNKNIFFISTKNIVFCRLQFDIANALTLFAQLKEEKRKRLTEKGSKLYNKK